MKLQKNRTMTKFGLLAFVFLFTVLFSFSGCKKNDDITNAQLESLATADAAQTVGLAVASSDGGALDQMSDVLTVATPVGLCTERGKNFKNFGLGNSTVVKTYDSISGWWNVTVTRDRGVPGSLFYATYTRVYKLQFLNSLGIFQKDYITGVDTAYSIKHEIVSGTGYFKTPKQTHILSSLSGNWVATGTNTPTVTINTISTVPYIRNASDTIIRGASMRTLTSTLTLNFVDVKGPRGSGLNWHSKTSGTITGTYHAFVTFQKGETYKEKTIDRVINITLTGGQGKGLLNIGGTKFDFDLDSGDLY